MASKASAGRKVQTINGKRFVLVEEREFRQLEQQAKRGTAAKPEYPAADAKGSRPAVPFARVSIAHSIIEGRRAAGLTQEDLARLSGVRQETISRLESGKHSPTVRTVEKIERALQEAARKGRSKRR